MHDSDLSSPPLPLHWPLGLADGRVQVRRWLMDGGDPTRADAQGWPVWARAMAAGHPEAVDELLDADANLELRDPEGNGWLHWAIQTGQAVPLTMMGMARLGPTWWTPNHSGQTPFHLIPQPMGIAQALGARYWAERLSWSRLVAAGGDPVAQAEAAGAMTLAQAWRRWRAQCKA